MARKTRRPPVATDKRFKRHGADSGPAERWQHGARTLEFTQQAGVFAARALEEHALDRLFIARLIDARMREAGLKLCEDYVGAQIAQRVAASYSGNPRQNHAGGFERSEVQEASYQRWKKALNNLDAAAQDQALHVCCHGFLPELQQLGALKAGLQKLARHYGIR